MYCRKYESEWNVKDLQISAKGLAKNEDPKTSKWNQFVISAVNSLKLIAVSLILIWKLIL